MKYSFNTWAFSHFPCWVPSYPIEEVIKRLAEIGYDALELGCAQPQAWPYFTDKEKRASVRKTLKENNLRISSVLPAPGGGPGGNIASANVLEREWTKQYWKDCIDMGLEMDDCKTLLCVCGWYIYGTRKRDPFVVARQSLENLKAIENSLK